MRRSLHETCLMVGAIVLLVRTGHGAVTGLSLTAPGAAELAGALLRDCGFLLEASQRAALDEINRALREAESKEQEATDEGTKREATDVRNTAATKLIALLNGVPRTVRISLVDGQPRMPSDEPVALPGDTGGLLFRFDAGPGPTRCVNIRADFAQPVSSFSVDVASAGVTWALVGLRNVPDRRTSFLLELEQQGGPTLKLPVQVKTITKGRLKETILSADTGKPVPATVRMVWKTDGLDRKPSNAIEFAEQFNNIGSGRRKANLPGRLRGAYWCVPEPFDMAVPPGEWEIVVRRGVEHIPLFDTFSVKSNQVVQKTYRPRRWVDMRKHGWYSGDDHVHCQLLSQADAERLMAWIQAEDIHLANVVKMGDINRTWFEQRGFGPEYRVINGDYVLSPGQECPRTDAELGHTIAMRTTSMVRDTDKYYLYDWVFDTVHAQGGLSGYAHVNSNRFHVDRDMSINIPKNKVDFVELLQFAHLGTAVYYDFLNTGFKMTASAGSDVPWGGTVGEVRMYTYLGDQPFTADAWFAALRRGRTFVTNGPMLDFRVDGAGPGDEIRASENRSVRITARAWGHSERMVPTKLELIRHGDTMESVANPKADKAELEIALDVPAGHGFWVAARAEGSDGSRAHTTPVYVIREPLRFWKHEAVDELIRKRLASLDEVEGIVEEARKRNQAGELENNRALKQLALQGQQLLERVAAARKLYENLSRTAEREQSLRQAVR